MKKYKYAKKILPFISFFSGIVVTLLFMVYLAFETDSTRSAAVDIRTGIRYVLVNEDLGGPFNGVNYNFGVEFVSLVNQDVNNNWQTASRGLAEAGFKAGNFDAMIILPQNFTERLLSLESFTPEVAQIDYSVRLGENDITNTLVSEQVSTVLDEFNHRIVQMYFSTILGSLFDAQLNVSQVISDESARHQRLMTDIEAPFSKMPFQFSGVINDANSLNGASDSWMGFQAAFNERAQGILTSVAEGFSNQLTDLKHFVELQHTLTTVNHRNAEFVLGEQSQLDEIFYHEQFTGLNQSILTQLNLFDEECENEVMTCNNESVIRRFRSAGQLFENDQNSLIADLGDQIDSLETREEGHVEVLMKEAQDMLMLRNQIASIYFGNGWLTPETVTDENIKSAILNMITMSEETGNELDPIFSELINDYLEQIAPDDLGNMITELYTQNIISPEQYEMYHAKLALISRFAYEEAIELNQNVDFTFIDTQDVQRENDASFAHVATFMLEPISGEIQTIHLNSDSDVRIHDIEAVRESIEAYIKQRIEEHPLDVEVTVVDDQTLAIYFFEYLRPDLEYIQTETPDLSTYRDLEECLDSEECPEAEGVMPELPTCPEAEGCPEPEGVMPELPTCPEAEGCPEPEGIMPELPTCPEAEGCLVLNMNITVQMELRWYLTEEELETSFTTTEFEWVLNEAVIFSGNLSTFVSHYERSLALTADLSALLNQLSRLDHASRQIVTIFGAPTATSQTVFGFIADIQDEALTIREHAPYHSIYRRYGTFTDEELETFILDSLVIFFREQGTESYNEINRHYEELTQIINTFYNNTPVLIFQTLLGRMLPSDSLLIELNSLLTWQEITRKELEDVYDGWNQSENVTFLLREYSGENLDEETAVMHFDAHAGLTLIENASSAATGTQGDLEVIESNISEGEDLSGLLTSLVVQTEGVSTDIEQLLNNIEMLSSRFRDDISSNELFSDNFSRVMENARIGGTDNLDVLEFLANPIHLSGAIERAEATSIVPLYLTIIASMLILTASYGFRYFDARIQNSKEDNELIGLSLPAINRTVVCLLLFFSISIGLLFGWITRNLAGVTPTMWIMWITISISIGILIVTYFSRQFPRLTLLLSTLLMTTYLLLTPFLGIQIEPDTLVAFLFNASPLQSFENLMQSLTTGGQIRMIIMPLMLLISVVAVVLNLYVKVNSEKEKKDAI